MILDYEGNERERKTKDDKDLFERITLRVEMSEPTFKPPRESIFRCCTISVFSIPFSRLKCCDVHRHRKRGYRLNKPTPRRIHIIGVIRFKTQT
jgi:hypothetical protein